MDASAASLQDIALRLSSMSEALAELSHDVGNMATWVTMSAVFIMVAVIVIACRMPHGSNDEEGAPAARRRARHAGGLLLCGKGKVFELQFDYGIAQFGSLPTNRVRVLDCDDEWVLIESTNPKKPAQAVVRISTITDVKEIAE